MWIPPPLITDQSKLKDWHGIEWLRWQYFTPASYWIYHGTKRLYAGQQNTHEEIKYHAMNFSPPRDARPIQTQFLHLQHFPRARETTGKLFSTTQTRLLQFCSIQSLFKVCWARSRHCHSSCEKYKPIK